MNTESHQQIAQTHAIEALTRQNPRFALYRDQNPTFRQADVDFWTNAILSAHNAALTTEHQRHEKVLSETHEARRIELARLKADYMRELDAKLEQINAQAETIRDERQRREQANEALKARDAFAKRLERQNKELNDRFLSALAAIEKHNNKYKTLGTGNNTWLIEGIDLSLLHERDKELQDRIETFRKNWPQVHKAIRSDIMLGEAGVEINALAELYDEISI